MSDIAPIEIRTVQLDDVDYKDRVIDLIAVPYDEWTPVPYRDGMIEESFAPGAFRGVTGRRDRFRVNVNLEHDESQHVGRVQTLDPTDPKGLRAELKIRRTEAGDQALKDAADGMLDASIGFGVLPQNEQWESKDRRRIVKAFLDHIALTWTPAYPGAKVLAVRARHPSSMTAAVSPTPNLDRILAERMASAYGMPPVGTDRLPPA